MATEAMSDDLFDSDLDVLGFEHMLEEHVDELIAMLPVPDSTLDPPLEAAISPGKSSHQHSSLSPDGGHAQYTPTSTNPESSNDSSFEVEDGTFSASSAYTPSPVEDYVYVLPSSGQQGESTARSWPPPSTLEAPSSFAQRSRGPSVAPSATASHRQWTPFAITPHMEDQNAGPRAVSPTNALNNAAFAPSQTYNEGLVADMPSTGAFGYPSWQGHLDSAWPMSGAYSNHPAYSMNNQVASTSWGYLPQFPQYLQQPQLPFNGWDVNGMPARDSQQLHFDQAAEYPRDHGAAMQQVWNHSHIHPPQIAFANQQPIPASGTVPLISPSYMPPNVNHSHVAGHRYQEAALVPVSGSATSSRQAGRERSGVDSSVLPTRAHMRTSRNARPSKGGRQKNTHLNEHVRQKSSAMRKTGACWRCAMQRDQCDGKDPCTRCEMRCQKGQQNFFGCDRSKLPDFILDFLPPSMTLMHQKQTIEDCVHEQVRSWDTRTFDVYLTSGYGHALRWKLNEFEPASPELLGQFQYLQDSAGRSKRITKYSPPLGITKLDPSDDTHFQNYLNELMSESYLEEFPWICFEEETHVNDFQASMLALLCRLCTRSTDVYLRELLQKIVRMMIITYIMGHTLTISEETLRSVISFVKHPYKPDRIERHTSPRLANRQLKFFFHILRSNIYEDVLRWTQNTLHTSGSKDSTWLPAFCVLLGFGMVLEEVQRTIQIQADSKAQKREKTPEEAQQEALNACERIDKRYALLIGLFQCKYRDKKWTARGSFGNSTPVLKDKHEVEFLLELRALLEEKQNHLLSRRDVEFKTENQCQYTSRLVARFLIPFLHLPPQ